MNIVGKFVRWDVDANKKWQVVISKIDGNLWNSSSNILRILLPARKYFAGDFLQVRDGSVSVLSLLDLVILRAFGTVTSDVRWDDIPRLVAESGESHVYLKKILDLISNVTVTKAKSHSIEDIIKEENQIILQGIHRKIRAVASNDGGDSDAEYDPEDDTEQKFEEEMTNFRNDPYSLIPFLPYTGQLELRFLCVDRYVLCNGLQNTTYRDNFPATRTRAFFEWLRTAFSSQNSQRSRALRTDILPSYCISAQRIHEIAGYLGVVLSQEPDVFVRLPMDKYISVEYWKMEGLIHDFCSTLVSRNSNTDWFVTGDTVELDVTQRSAVKQALMSHLCIINGKAGTGKTYVINFLRNHLRYMNRKCLVTLCAPTGMAASKFVDGMTIHRYLCLPQNVAESNLPHLFIVDEMSMVDIRTFARLLQRISGFETIKLVLVGDTHQLPPIGLGHVFYDLIGTCRIPTVELETIYRQNEASNILSFAYRISAGDRHIAPYNLPDLMSIEYSSDAELEGQLKDFLACQPIDDWQIVTYTNEMSRRINGLVKPSPLGFRVGDRVINLQNVYTIDSQDSVLGNELLSGCKTSKHVHTQYVITRISSPISNGFVGYIKKISRESAELDTIPSHGHCEVEVEYQDTYSKPSMTLVMCSGASKRLMQDRCSGGRRLKNKTPFEHAYCITIHKAQGSEFQNVIAVFPRAVSRELCYTAITRAKAKLIVLRPRTMAPIDELEKADTNLIQLFHPRVL